MRWKLIRSPEKIARREKILEMLQALDIVSWMTAKNCTGKLSFSSWRTAWEAMRYDQAKKDTENSRNSYSKKTLKASFGDTEIAVPRARKSEFNPQILKKNQTSVSEDIEAKIISWYAKGKSGDTG